ncbi:MAG: hypothetical protein ABID54_04895 [Pseudomonadota bacterium]
MNGNPFDIIDKQAPVNPFDRIVKQPPEEPGLESPGLLDPIEMISWAASGGITGLGMPAKALAKRVADWGMLGFPGLAKGLYGLGRGAVRGVTGLATKKVVQKVAPRVEEPISTVAKDVLEEVWEPGIIKTAEEGRKIGGTIKAKSLGAEAASEAKPLMEERIAFEPHKEMSEAVTGSMVSKGIKREPEKLFTEQLMEEIRANPERFDEISSKYGISAKDFAGKIREEAASYARWLGKLGMESKRLAREVPEIGEALEELNKATKGVGVWDHIQSGWKRFSNTWRGVLVSQLSTAMRNAEVQTGRVGLNVFEEGLNATFQKMLGKVQTVHPLDGVEQLFKIFQRNKGITNKILAEHPKEYSRLFSTYMSDIESASKTGGLIQKGVDLLNTANRFQEYTIRRAVFMGKLDQFVRAEGMNLAEIIEKNQVGKIPLESIHKAVSDSLEFTFASTPKWGSIGRKFTDFVTSLPGATFVMPFPRFLINSLKFQFEYSPLGILKLLSPAERAAFGQGNMKVMSRAILGSSMLGAAWQIRNSEYAGEKWYELKVGDKTVDMRPFNPFISYMFVADVAKKARDGTLYSLTSKDLAMGVLSQNLRAGTGLYAMDRILSAMTSTGDPEKALNVVKQFAGEIAGGFATPFNQVKEFMYGMDEYLVREKRSEPMMGPVKEKIPGLEKELPPFYVPTREKALTREYPAMRQATGIILRTKNKLEKELDRLGFESWDIVPSVGDPQADNLIRKYMGIVSERVVLPVLDTPTYNKLSDEMKGLFIKQLLEEVRGPAREAAEQENPRLFARIKLEKIPKREKLLIREPLQKAIKSLRQ